MINLVKGVRMKMSGFLLCKIFILLIGILFLYPAKTLAHDAKEYCPLNQGDTWTYLASEDQAVSNKTFIVNGNELIGNVETIKVIGPENIYDCFVVDTEGVKLFKQFQENGIRIFSPPMMLFPDLEVGEEKVYSSKSINQDKNEVIDMTENVFLESSISDIEVPAGQFHDCLKFSILTKFKDVGLNGNYGSMDCTFWMASGIGKVKSSCFTVVYSVNGEEKNFSEIQELISAVIDGKQIEKK